MAAFDGPLSYVCFDLYTGAYQGRLPLAGVTFSSQLLNAGSCSGTLDIASPAVQALGPLGLSAPARTALAIDYQGALIWGGVIWPRDYKFDSTSRQLTVTATELWSYPSARAQATDYSAPPFSGFTGNVGSGMAIWNATNTAADGVYDPMLVAWQLLYDALTQVPYGNILGGLSIAANGFTSPSDYLASGTATPGGDYTNINYPYPSLQTLGSIISQNAQNGLGVGFDYAVDVVYSAGPGSPPVGTVNLSYPRRGRTYAQNNLVMNCGQAISYELPEDGTQTGNTVYEQGSSGSLSVSQNIQPLEGGYPILEQIMSRSNITSANIMQVLATLGVADLALKSYAVATPTCTFDLFTSPVPLGEFIVGDDVRWIIPATDGNGEIFDPRVALDEEWRITGYNATAADDGQSTIAFTLSQPPSLLIEGPALP